MPQPKPVNSKPSNFAPHRFKDSEFELAFQHSPIGMCIVSLEDGAWLRVNSALIETFGYTEEEFFSMTFNDITHPDDHHLGIEVVNNVKQGKLTSHRFEKRYIHRNGRIIYALVNTNAVKDELGQPKYLVTQILDISEQRRAEAHARMIIDSTFDGFWDWHIQDNYEYLSPRFWEMLGVDPSTKRHHPDEWRALLFEEDLEKFDRNFNLHIKTQGDHPFYQELRFQHSDGSTVWVLCKGAVVEWGENGKPIRMMGTHTDITDLKIAQEALAQSSKMVALGEMAGGIAHEINNPLAVIMGHSNRLRILLEQGELNREEILKTCDKLEQTSLRISRIVKGLRIYSREVDSEELTEISVHDLIDDTLSFCIEKFRGHGIDLKVEIEPEDAVLLCRPIQISQVLLNLLNNSFDAIRDLENRWIRIQFSTSDDGSRFAIVDSGNGIPKRIRDKIMQPFFTTKPVGVGTGLGLSICSGIVSAHGGVLNLDESAANTTFCLTFPHGEFIR